MVVLHQEKKGHNTYCYLETQNTKIVFPKLLIEKKILFLSCREKPLQNQMT